MPFGTFLALVASVILAAGATVWLATAALGASAALYGAALPLAIAGLVLIRLIARRD